jgi:hypothetical protein
MQLFQTVAKYNNGNRQVDIQGGQNKCTKVVAQAREFKRQKFANELDKEEGRKNVLRIAKHMA